MKISNIKNNKIFKKSIYMKNFAIGIFKILLAFLSNSIPMLIYALYTISIGMAKRTVVKGRKKKSEYDSYILIGIIVLISSIIYEIYAIYMYIYGTNAHYNMYFAIGMAIVCFIDLVLAIIGLIKANRRNDIKTKIAKLLNLATSIILISVTQIAILSFIGNGDISKTCGLGGMFFSGISILIGLYIIIYVNKMRNTIE